MLYSLFPSFVCCIIMLKSVNNFIILGQLLTNDTERSSGFYIKQAVFVRSHVKFRKAFMEKYAMYS